MLHSFMVDYLVLALTCTFHDLGSKKNWAMSMIDRGQSGEKKTELTRDLAREGTNQPSCAVCAEHSIYGQTCFFSFYLHDIDSVRVS